MAVLVHHWQPHNNHLQMQEGEGWGGWGGQGRRRREAGIMMMVMKKMCVLMQVYVFCLYLQVIAQCPFNVER